MANIWIFNDSGSESSYEGQDIADQAYYQVSATDRLDWSNNSSLLTDIGSGDAIVATNNTSGNHITDVSDAINYLKNGPSIPTDSEGFPVNKRKITKTGWHLQDHCLEFETSKLNSLYNKDRTEIDLAFTTIKYYDNTDTELTAGTQTELDNNCVKTVITWEPAFDYEILGATFFQSTVPTGNVRVWVTAVPDLTPAQGGSISFVQGGLNLKRLGNSGELKIDGKVPKLMSYNATYHTNKFEILVKHDTGIKHPIFLVVDLYKG